MDAGAFGAFGTVAAFVAFVAVVIWAWSRRRKPDFDAAARLPLEEDERRDADAGDRR